ncbi:MULTISPECIES: hypothetical protein [Pseudomonas syringae group]|uniref:hypothetical protein n=2 Tax=Pseudomonas TaxID=286 RepID=UPI00138F7917|nr:MULTISPECIES: hypothetical protein [Pseudomonas syringae group]
MKNRAFCVRLLVEMKLLSVVLHQQAALSELFIRQSKKTPFTWITLVKEICTSANPRHDESLTGRISWVSETL